ncbi:GntR family transcriptional regulator [Sedimentitalea sp. JM2-8]|uniref:GntR family transcriptional regulator n=1 Tax=Sedimentitalea xiamensis TaxID=3050037 RepID=A0ABT7F949_9RHOB|nr:GntR family transcriptional regulator [Sedimentitalea xiamensis]MDK3071622.1 GntR family transcriptional regulator [Sedimentitalea xiamensis]
MNMVKKTADPAGGNTVPVPAHEQVYQKLKAQILFGEMAPGQAVTIQGLTAALDAGMTPVREAIRRLISDGALVFQGNRRVSVPLLTNQDIEQIIYLRKTIEYELTKRAVERMKPAVSEELSRIDAALDGAISTGNVGLYLERNYQFHAVLYAQAEAPIMAGVVDRLWLRFGPSLRVVCGRFGTQSLPDRHKDLLAALGGRDSEAAARAIVLDIEQGMDQIAAVIDAEN